MYFCSLLNDIIKKNNKLRYLFKYNLKQDKKVLINFAYKRTKINTTNNLE